MGPGTCEHDHLPIKPKAGGMTTRQGTKMQLLNTDVRFKVKKKDSCGDRSFCSL